MRLSRLAGVVAGVAMIGAAAMPAAAQGLLPIEMILPPAPRSADRAPSALARSVASARLLTPAPLPTSFTPLKPTTAPVQAPRVQVPPVQLKPEPAATASAPVAPAPVPASAPRPPAAQTVAAPPPQLVPPKPTTMAAATPEAALAAAKTEPLTERAIVERANAYFTNLNTLVADFTQIGGDGRRLGGTLYLQRPGKVRFEYDKPATLEVIADGSSVAVRDTKLATQDLYSISQTPLKFLLREKVNLGQDIKITGIANDGDAVRVALEDRSTLGGTSKITLFFDPTVEKLTQWRIVDPQGFQTTVMLNKIERGQRVDQSLFVINYDKAIANDNTSR